MRRLLVVLALVGCDLGTGPDVEYENRRPIVPPPEYVAWFRAVEQCRSVLAVFEEVRWFVADEVRRDGEPAGGAIDFPNEITIRSDYVYFWPVVRHEMDHFVTQTGDGLHLPDGGTACDGEH